MGVPEVRRLKQLENEKAKLKKLVADLTLDRPCSRTSCTEHGEARRLGCEVAGHLRTAFSSNRTAGLARTTGFARTSQCYRSRRNQATALRMRLRELAASQVRYGFRRVHILLRREGWAMSHKLTYRLDRKDGHCQRKQTEAHLIALPHFRLGTGQCFLAQDQDR